MADTESAHNSLLFPVQSFDRNESLFHIWSNFMKFIVDFIIPVRLPHCSRCGPLKHNEDGSECLRDPFRGPYTNCEHKSHVAGDYITGDTFCCENISRDPYLRPVYDANGVISYVCDCMTTDQVTNTLYCAQSVSSPATETNRVTVKQRENPPSDHTGSCNQAVVFPIVSELLYLFPFLCWIRTGRSMFVA
ncbi:hypothetical protein ElyMa_002012400 [Elysia marginata]|uniref:UPAR/Ly6 domain-containing protein n=1 Tax=Elysia marginata TaxID=1093978 RepID=A0AAV4F3N4_9GAST|nr:hypothetical protein ElyMa_002012400 [Elysia marginata]